AAFKDTKWFKSYPGDFVYAGTGRGYLIGYIGEDKDVIIPSSVEKISAEAFLGNQAMESVAIPPGVTDIGTYAFFNCENLEKVVYGGNLSSVGRDAFRFTKWLDEYPGDYVCLGRYLIKYKGVNERVLIPNVIYGIGDYCFEDANKVLYVRVPVSVTNIGENPFYLFDDDINKKYAELFVYKDSYAAKYYAKNSKVLIKGYLNVPGDMDGDGKVTAADARLILRYIAKMGTPSDAEIIVGDVNGDNYLNTADARLILRLVAKLESFDAESLLTKPSTPFEVLLAYNAAVQKAALKQMGYTKTVFNKLDNWDVDPTLAALTSVKATFSKGLVSEKRAESKVYDPDSKAAIDNLTFGSMVNDNMIKSAKCEIKNGLYNISITLKDEENKDGIKSDTGRMFPVMDREQVNDLVKDKPWMKVDMSILKKDETAEPTTDETAEPAEDADEFDGYLPEFTYILTYKDCTATATVSMDGFSPKDITLAMTQHFRFGGQIFLSYVDEGNFDRKDTIKYTDFKLYPDGFFDVPEEEE
ncbi:MAG: leucine-rich repeat protein, partial [Oscillospiraceae bacterium]|nr:leucine-rich repeat protein [Oscillospiraceae bacterium]